MSEAFQTLFVRQTAFGTLAAVSLPSGLEPVGGAVLARLHDAEQGEAATHRARRQIEYAGGRIAWHAAGGTGPLLTGSERQPLVDGPWSVSISHKDDVALALVAPLGEGTVGLDLEGGGREPLNIASRVLRPEELDEFDALPIEQRWPRLMRAFALKEATYKAIYPHVQRYVAFHEARVRIEPPSVELFPSTPFGVPLTLEAALESLDVRVVAMVRAKRSG
ncbi:MAG: 4'-phosphopantetheinyl transferase superfamily protein [Archangium sp.]|nr:4'-phosphopantetheinyl transferase superfamily protein [Archangium sp.]